MTLRNAEKGEAGVREGKGSMLVMLLKLEEVGKKGEPP